MTTTVRLAPGGSADAPAGILQLDWRLADDEPGAVNLVVELLDGSDAPGVERLSEGRLLLLDVSTIIVVRAVAPSGGALPAGVHLVLRLSVQQQGSTVAHLVLPDRDVSGTTNDEQLRVEPSGQGTLRVKAAGERFDEKLPVNQEALRAVYAARRVLGVPRVPEAEQRRLVLALDLSASVLPHVRSGALRSLLAVAVGLAAVVGRDPVLEVWSCGPSPIRLADLDESGLDDFVQRAIDEHGVGLSGGAAPLVAGPLRYAGPDTALLHLTDAVPPDVEALLHLLRTGGCSWHLLALAPSSLDQARPVAAWQDELGQLRALAADAPMRWASVTPDLHQDWLAARLADDRQLDDLVARLGLTVRGA